MLKPTLSSPGARLRELWKSGIVVMPGAFSPFSAICAVKQGAKAVYLSGGAMTNNALGQPDIALMSLDEMSSVAARTCQVVDVPVISDADTGFGEGWNVARTVIEMERAGLAGIHLEDQASPKRCGHLDGKELISAEDMAAKIRAACYARKDGDFLLIARTDARGVEGLDSAIARAKTYLSAGADAIFPEGLTSVDEFKQFRDAISAPLLANMTEFGKTPLISADEFEAIGYQMVIFPVTALRVIAKTLGDFYGELLHRGTQVGWMDKMVTRAELYDLIDYPQYEQLGKDWNS